MVSTSLVSAGRAFHTFGAMLLNARSPKDVRVFGCWSLVVSVPDLSVRALWDRIIICFIYMGAGVWKHLWTNVRVLKCILCFTGSQCSERRTGVIGSLKGDPVKSLAAQFCAFWRGLMVLSGHSANKTLFLSRCEKT